MSINAKTLTGKIALITGASRGIGKATALRLAKDGAIAAIHFAKEEKAAQETVAIIQADGGGAFLVQAELSTQAGINSLFQQVDPLLTERTGSNQFDILVNNAAIAPASSLEGTDEETFDQLFRVNVKAPFFLTQQAVQNGSRGRDPSLKRVACRKMCHVNRGGTVSGASRLWRAGFRCSQPSAVHGPRRSAPNATPLRCCSGTASVFFGYFPLSFPIFR